MTTFAALLDHDGSLQGFIDSGTACPGPNRIHVDDTDYVWGSGVDRWTMADGTHVSKFYMPVASIPVLSVV